LTPKAKYKLKRELRFLMLQFAFVLTGLLLLYFAIQSNWFKNVIKNVFAMAAPPAAQQEAVPVESEPTNSQP